MYHQKFNPDEEQDIRKGCESGDLGCVDCKMNAAEKINKFLDPFRERRKSYETQPERIKQILKNGEDRARTVAQRTMAEVHQAMQMG